MALSQAKRIEAMIKINQQYHKYSSNKAYKDYFKEILNRLNIFVEEHPEAGFQDVLLTLNYCYDMI